MPVFIYKAFDQTRKRVSGIVTQDNARMARSELREKGFAVISIDQKSNATTKERVVRQIFSNRHASKVASFFSELSTLLSVGIPLLDALDTLCEQYRRSFKQSLLMARDSVSSGNSLSDALNSSHHTFDELSIKMVEVGENSGNLDVVLGKVASFKQRSLEMKDRILSSMLYPAIIFAVSILVTIFLMTVVIPMLLQNLAELDRPLPWPTQVVKFCSDTLVQYGWLLSIILGIVFAFAFFALRTNTGRRLRDSIIVRLPLFGNLSRRQAIARSAFVIGTLIDSGIEFVQAIGFAKRNTKNILLQEALQACETQVESGQDIRKALSRSNYFPPVTVQVFSVGQDAGRLSEMLFKLADDYDRQVDVATRRLSSTIEPILIMLISVFVGFIMFATVLPILEASNVF